MADVRGENRGDPSERRFEREFDYDRTVFFSDAVFAIAITLLVLSVNLPQNTQGPNPDVWRLLSDTRDAVFSYIISFAVIALLWVRHHAFFRAVTRVDPPLAVLNLAYLGLVAFLPFPAKVLGTYSDQPAGPVVFAVTLVAILGLSALSRVYVRRAGLLDASAPLVPMSRFAFAGGVFLLSIPVAFVDARVAPWCWALLAVPGLVRRTYKRLG